MPISYGESGVGFHFAEKLEDTMRFFNPASENSEYYAVLAQDQILENDKVNYFDSGKMYVTNNLTIIKKLTKEDIFKYALSLNDNDLSRVLSLYPFDIKELSIIFEKCKNNGYIKALSAIENFQTGDRKNFKRNRK